MPDASRRLLQLLSLLQAHRTLSGPELATRLGVDPRTVRRDVERLRSLGYPVNAAQGTAGYQLGRGSALPPLVLDDEEAVAVAVGLRTAAGGSVSGIEETSLRALTKLEQVLPSRLRYRVATLQAATARVAGQGPTVEAETLVEIADACRRCERLRFDYTSHAGRGSVRTVEPHRLVSVGRYWYLVAFDVDRDDWRTFRVDRIRPRRPTGPRFAPREPPGGDAAAYLNRQLSQTSWRVQATVVLHEDATTITDRIWPGCGVVEPVDDTSCLLHLGADTAADLVWMITSLNVAFALTDGPPELVAAVEVLGDRCRSAISSAR